MLKRPPIERPKIRRSAKGKCCTYRGPDCLYSPDTVRFCHLNGQIGGKGLGVKCGDLWGFYGCHNCETHYSDNTLDKDMRSALVLTALVETQQILYYEEKLISV